MLAVESLKKWKDWLWRVPIWWQWDYLVGILVWEPVYVCCDLPAEFQLSVMNPKEVLTKCLWLNRFPTFIVAADEDVIFGVQRD